MRKYLSAIFAASFALVLCGCCNCRYEKIPISPPSISSAYQIDGLDWRPITSSDEILVNSISQVIGGKTFFSASMRNEYGVLRAASDPKDWRWAPGYISINLIAYDLPTGEMIYAPANTKALMRTSGSKLVPFPSPFVNPHGSLNKIGNLSDGSIIADSLDFGACCKPPTNITTMTRELKRFSRVDSRWHSVLDTDNCLGSSPMGIQGTRVIFGPCQNKSTRKYYYFLSNNGGLSGTNSAEFLLDGFASLVAPISGNRWYVLYSKNVNGTYVSFYRIFDSSGNIISEGSFQRFVYTATHNAEDKIVGATGRDLFIGNLNGGNVQVVKTLPVDTIWQDVQFVNDKELYAISIYTKTDQPYSRTHVHHSSDEGATWTDITSQIFPGAS